MSAFTEWLASEMKERGWSQGQLARESGLGQGTISRLLSGKQEPRLEVAKALGKVFDFSAQFIMEQGKTIDPPAVIDRDTLGDYERKILDELDDMSDDFKLTVLKTVRAWRLYVQNKESGDEHSS